MSDPRPLLIYDGDCAFCTWWVRYWQRLTGAAVRYAPYQEVAAQYPQIAPAAFRRAVQYVGADGRVASGAEASLRTLAHAPGKGHWLWLYRRLPGFAWVAERAYAAIAAHRGPALRASRALWGAELWPVRLDRTAEWALRALALVWLAAFASMGVQVAGLVGPDGLLPARDYLGAMALRHPGAAHVALFPTLFWFGAGDAALRAACAAGVLAMLCALAGMARRTAFALAFVLYLSLFYAGQAFTSFQWDLLLLEAGAIAAVLGRRPALLVWTLRWLVWRFMLMSGLVKLLGDPAWRELDALRYHFMTQPLPAPLAWPAARAPDALLAAGGVATLVIELVLPFFVLLPRRPRMAAAWA
ncbi:MAG TPA: lipase maturation factor family protein, partial [Ideonella sp.]|nr:lipase maturation factor family protein [Ideonella sp.]